MLREERKWNDIKCSLKPGKQKKRKDIKEGKRYSEQKTVKNMVDNNSMMLMITFNINGLNMPIKKFRFSGGY